MEDNGVFKSSEMKTHVKAPWEDEMESGDFVSYAPGYEAGKYFNLFEKYTFTCAAPKGTSYKGEEPFSMTYYFYNPLKHGADSSKKYPLLTFFHGATNSLNGELCINYCGGELFASPEYQEKMGGAFILIPIANEYRAGGDKIEGGWHEDYYPAPVHALFEKVYAEYGKNLSKKLIFGNSSGGHFVWTLAKRYPDFFDALIPVGGSDLPNEEEFCALEKHGTHFLVLHGKRDELCPFDEVIKPFEERLARTRNCMCFFPEFVRNSDGGVASINFGFEMGQHCLINPMQENLMFASGEPMWQDLPRGITGWIFDNFAEK